MTWSFQNVGDAKSNPCGGIVSVCVFEIVLSSFQQHHVIWKLKWTYMYMWLGRQHHTTTFTTPPPPAHFHHHDASTCDDNNNHYLHLHCLIDACWRLDRYVFIFYFLFLLTMSYLTATTTTNTTCCHIATSPPLPSPPLPSPPPPPNTTPCHYQTMPPLPPPPPPPSPPNHVAMSPALPQHLSTWPPGPLQWQQQGTSPRYDRNGPKRCV